MYRLQQKLDVAQAEADRLAMEWDKSQILASKHKDEFKKLQDDHRALQEMHERTSIQMNRFAV